ncbi:MAG TPA: tail assembly protein [Allosphingosinicella sp.]|jgi:predicted phage tail protein
MRSELSSTVSGVLGTELDPELRAIRLYGKLGAMFGRLHYLAVSSLCEAVHALSMMLPGFKDYMTRAHDKGVAFAVFYGKRNLSEQELLLEGAGDIRIAPVIRGRKNGSVFQIILGVALIAVAAFFTAGAALSVFSAGGLWGAVATMGLSMVIGGVVGLLTPVPRLEVNERPENTPSSVFDGPVNTTAQGHPFPVLYGELFIGSAVLSAGIHTEDAAIIPANTNTTGSNGSFGGGSAPWHLERYAQ